MELRQGNADILTRASVSKTISVGFHIQMLSDRTIWKSRNVGKRNAVKDILKFVDGIKEKEATIEAMGVSIFSQKRW